MSWFDLLALCMVVVVALWGWSAGAVAQLLTMVGLWLGLLIGVVVLHLVGHDVSGNAGVVLVFGTLFGCALVFGALGNWGGNRVRGSLRRSPFGAADKVLGVAVGMAASLLAVWFVGNLLATSTVPTVNEAVRESRVLRTVNRVLPAMPDFFAQIESYLSTQGLPVVFVNPPPGLIASAPLPDVHATEAAAAAARSSTVRVVGNACNSVKFGSGFVAQFGLVITNAHVVAGESSTYVDDQTGSHRATVVFFDPQLDVALLRVTGLSDPPLAIKEDTVARGTTAAILGFPGGTSFHAEPSAVNERFKAVGLDIYGGALTTREVYELHGVVVPGDSGGPLVATGQAQGTTGIPTGTVIGLIFGNSPSNPSIGYALTMHAVTDTLAHAASGPVSTGACLP